MVDWVVFTIFVAPLVSLLVGGYSFLLSPRLETWGINRRVQGLNNERCRHFPELQACEDQWLDRASGLSYLACTSHESRKHWVPATSDLNALEAPEPSPGYFAILDLNTEKHRRLKLLNFPDSRGIYVHGFDIYQEAGRLTVFAINHRLPANRELAPKTGADSVIEVFETTLGSDELRWIRTLEAPEIRTPNNLVAVSHTQVYWSNDHRHKAHWTRALEPLVSPPSDIGFCSIDSGRAICDIASTPTTFPNGLARGPGDTLWQASSLGRALKRWEIQADHSLVLQEEIPLVRVMDNINVDDDGQVFIAVLADIWAFTRVQAYNATAPSPVEVYVLRDNTDSARYFGAPYRIERVFADDGQQVTGTTNVIHYKDTLWLTGNNAPAVSACTVPF